MIDLDIPLNLETKLHHENAVPKKAVYATIHCRFIDWFTQRNPNDISY